MEKPPVLSPDLVEEVDALASELERRPDHADLARKFEWLLDALVIRGQLPTHYKERAANIRADRTSVQLTLVQDKYTKESPDIDCGSRLHLCEARCCRFEVALSAQDIADRIPFDLHRPYMLPRDPVTKRCSCMDAAGACTIYDKRPASCRVYDCRTDPRVWIDFEARIPAPMPEKITPEHAPISDGRLRPDE
ncbi:MAG: YkgJ family cysteine cluster protein [Myxococcales bacterium]|nr:YkgJ family cysteine cluster protein [Myxococcales bacterium]